MTAATRVFLEGICRLGKAFLKLFEEWIRETNKTR